VAASPVRRAGPAIRHTKRGMFSAACNGSMCFRSRLCNESVAQAGTRWSDSRPGASGGARLREEQADGRASADRARQVHAAAVRLRHVLHDREPEACAALAAGPRGIRAVDRIGTPGAGGRQECPIRYRQTAMAVPRPPAGCRAGCSPRRVWWRRRCRPGCEDLAQALGSALQGDTRGTERSKPTFAARPAPRTRTSRLAASRGPRPGPPGATRRTRAARDRAGRPPGAASARRCPDHRQKPGLRVGVRDDRRSGCPP